MDIDGIRLNSKILAVDDDGNITVDGEVVVNMESPDDHNDLTNIGVNTHVQIDTYIASGPHAPITDEDGTILRTNSLINCGQF